MIIADWSVNPRNDWEVVQEFSLNNFPKMVVDPKSMIKKEDLRWCGKLFRFDKDYDKVSARKPLKLPIAENVAFYNPPASEDEQLDLRIFIMLCFFHMYFIPILEIESIEFHKHMIWWFEFVGYRT